MSGRTARALERPRLAFFTPLWPERTGLSDYSEELLPHLGELADVDLVIGPYRPSSEAILRRFRILGVEEFLRDPCAYDAAVYQVANSLHHGYMIPCVATVPGILVLHDYCLQHLMIGLTLRTGNVAGLEWALAPIHGTRARSLARRLVFGLADPNTLSFAGRLVEASRAVVVHSEHARRRVLADFPDATLRVVRHGVPAEEEDETAGALRSRYGFGPDDFILASITTLVHTKRLDLAVRGLGLLRRRRPEVKLLVLGGGSVGARTRRLIERLGLRGAVTRTGWLPGEQYRGLIRVADLVVDLRYPSGSETSGSLLRAFAAGKPAVVSGQGSFLDLPEECCVKLPVGDGEVEALAAAAESLIEDPERRLRMGAAARRLTLVEHRLDAAARGLVDVVREVAASPAKAVGPPLPPGGSRPGRLAIVAAYRACRVGHLLRAYGVRDTARRIGEELKSRA